MTALSCVNTHFDPKSPLAAYRAEMVGDVAELMADGMDADAAWLQVATAKITELKTERYRIEKVVADAYDQAQGVKKKPAAEVPATVATHKDPGEPAEPVTPAVVAEAIKTGMQETDRKASSMKAELLAEIDQAVQDAPDYADFQVAVKSMGLKDATATFTDAKGTLGDTSAPTGYSRPKRTFKVEGDGVFTVHNTVRQLLTFRAKVESSPGFRDRQSRTNLTERATDTLDRRSTDAAISNMLDEGDFTAAVDFAESKGVKLEDVKLTKLLRERLEKWQKDQESAKRMAEYQAAQAENKPAPGSLAAMVAEKEAESAKPAEPEADDIPEAGVASQTFEQWAKAKYAGNEYKAKYLEEFGGNEMRAALGAAIGTIDNDRTTPNLLKEARSKYMGELLALPRETSISLDVWDALDNFAKVEAQRHFYDLDTRITRRTQDETKARVAAETAKKAPYEAAFAEVDAEIRRLDKLPGPPTKKQNELSIRRDRLREAIYQIGQGKEPDGRLLKAPATPAPEAQEPAPADEDMRGYAWALVKNGRVVRSGSLPSPEFSPASADTKMSYYKDMADKEGAELYVGGYPGAAAWAPQDGLIFGMTWVELIARQQRGGQGQRIPEGKMPKDAALAYSPKPAPAPEIQTPSEPKAAQSAAEPTKPNTEDSGAELTYNRRNRIKSGLKWDDIADKNDALKVKEAVKQNVYPRPDYQALVDGGMQPAIAHLVKQVYDAIAAKPHTRSVPSDSDLQTYIAGINRVMTGVLSWANDPASVQKWASKEARSAGAMLGRAVNLTDLAPDGKTMLQSVYPEGWKGNQAEVVVLGGNKLLGSLQPGYDESKRAFKAVGDGWPASQEAWQKRGMKVLHADKVGVSYYEFTGAQGNSRDPYVSITYSIGKTQIGRGATIDGARSKDDEAVKQRVASDMATWQDQYVVLDKHKRLVGIQPTEEAAMQTARDITKREAKTGGPDDSGIDVSMAQRAGVPRRMEGEDISSDRLKEAYGFKGVNFGNWMKGDTPALRAERQAHLNHAYDSFADLADLFGVPPQAMSLNGMLGLAIGAQGNGKFAAHFVPGMNEINLTRTSGAGSLAHEWGHALDHYFASQAGLAKASEPFLTEHASMGATMQRFEGGTNVTKQRFGDAIRPEIVARFKSIVTAMNKKQESADGVKLRMEQAKARAQKSVDGWLRSIKADYLRGKVDEAEFDRIANRISTLDLGDGKIAVSSVLHVPPPIDELRSLYQKTTGKRYSIEKIRDLASNVDHLAYLAADRDHVPQMVTTDYATNAANLDKEKGGKAYWSTNLEKFARAFDAFVSDTLAEKAAKNTYLSHAGRSGETVPTGDERTAINSAIKDLVDQIEVREDDTGNVVMFSRSLLREAGAGSQGQGRRDGLLARLAELGSNPEADVAGLFKRGPKAAGMPAAELRQIAASIAKDWANAPPIVVLDTITDGPAELRSEFEIQASQGAEGSVMGVFHGGKVYLIADSINSAEDAATVLLHESLGHYGIQGLLGSQMKVVLMQVASSMPAEISAKIKQYGLSQSKLRDRLIAAEEVLAELAQTKPESTLVQRAIAAIATWLRKHFPGLKLTQAEIIRDIIIPARKWVEGGAGGVFEPKTPMFSRAQDAGTDAFRKWFGDSKVVDDQGKPLVVYHGTDRNFTAFDTGKAGQSSGHRTAKAGIFFSASPEVAARFATEKWTGWPLTREFGVGSNIMPAYMAIRSPATITAEQFLTRFVRGSEDFSAFARQEQDAGRDGIRITGDPDMAERMGGEEYSADAWVAFRPEQIKSATGNNGEFDATNPDIRFARSAAVSVTTAQDLVNSKGGVFDFNRLGSTKQDRIRTVTDGARPFWLGALTRDQIADMYGAEIPPVKDYDSLTRAMENERAKMAGDADELYNEWAKLDPDVNDRLARIMLDATVHQVHPDGAFNQTRENNEERKRVHGNISTQFKLLPKEAQAMYGKVRDFHLGTLTKLRDSLMDRVKRQVENGNARAAALTSIRMQFDKYLENGPYFPLSRFGDFLVVATRAEDGERVVASYETAGEQQGAARKLEADGFTVKLKTAKSYSRQTDGAAGKFIASVLGTVDALDMDDAMLSGTTANLKSQLLDDINQMFIQALPDLSYRKHFMHRKGTAGFSSDVMRGFASSAFHSASHIARLNHGDKMTFALQDAFKAIEASDSGDFNLHSQVLNELTKRHDAAMNPNTHPIAAMLNQVGFVMYLGLSPAAGLVNMLQTVMVTMPHLGARYGFGKANGSLATAYKDILAAPVNAKNGWNAAQSSKLSTEERKVMSDLQDEGVIDLTQAHDLASATSLDTGNVSRSKAAFAMAKAMKVVGWTFHIPEVMNRQVTALSAYRLEMEKSGDQDEAKEAAREAIKRTHFDYSASNRARFMQGNVARVLLQFKQYSQNMTYLLGRAAHQALKGESPEVRAIARRQLVATLGVTFGMAGTLGLPGLGGAMGLIGMMVGALDDDDKPWDWKVEFRNLAADTFGKEAGEVLAHGIPRALMPWDISNRVGMGDMWWRNNGQEGQNPREQFASDMQNILGPTAGTVLGLYTAADQMARGNWSKAVEGMVPKALRDPLKALREGTDGVTNYNGEPLMDVTGAEVAGRLLGFAPARASEMYEAKGAVKNAETALNEKRQNLLSRMVKARIEGDGTAVQDLQVDIQAFNERNPAFKITMDSIMKSLLAKRRNTAETQDGIRLPKGKDDLRAIGRFAEVE